MLPWFSKCVKDFDVYKMSLYLGLKGKRTSRTFCGGILSIILLVAYLIVFIYLFNDLSNKQNQYYTLNNLRYNDPPKFNFTPNLNLNVEEEIPFFFFAFHFHDDEGNAITVEEVTKYFYIEAQLLYNNRKTNSSKILEEEYELSICDKDFKVSAEYFNLISFDKTQSLIMNKIYYCLDDSIINVEGDYVSQIYKYLSIKFKDCKSNPNKRIGCNTDKDKFSAFVKNFNIDIIYSYYYIQSDIVDKIPLQYFIKRNTIKISQRLYQKYDYYLSYSHIETEENLVLKFFGSLNSNFITIPKIVMNYATVTNTYVAIYFRSDYDYVYIIRSYKTFLNLISQLGGIWKFLIIIGVSMISEFNLKSMLNILGNSIYSVISSTVKKNTDLTENLDNYKNKGSEASPHYIILSNNKSELEAKLYIDVYKYERNRGLQISMEDMILQTYFTCFLDEEKKRIKKLEEKVESKILMKLDFLKILKFIKEFKILKSIILHKKNFLMRINKKNITHFKEILNISRKIQEKEMDMDLYSENDEEKRVKREMKFLNGLRYFRNKPVIDKNIDLKIFNMYKCDREIMRQYLMKNLEIIDK